MENKGNCTKNTGSMDRSTGLLSSTLKDSLKTVTPVKPTGVFKTTEDDASIQYPGSEVVLRTK